MQYAQMFTVSTEWVAENVLNIVTALIVLVAGWSLSGFLARHSANLLPRTRRIDTTLAPLLAQVVRYAILAMTVVIVLAQFGIQTASILAVFGAVGLAIALALQGTLSNLAAGILLIWLRPFNVGEYIDGDGVSGTVVEVGLFSTRLRTYDGIAVFAPNSRLWNAKIVNYSRELTRMVELKIGIDYASDLSQARAVLLAAADDRRVLAEPAPQVFVDSLAENAVVVGLRAWVVSSDWWTTKVEITERAKLALEEAGIEIPANQLDINLRRAGPPAAAS